MLLPRAYLAAQRAQQLEADALAVRALAHAGWDPAALLSYIERLSTADKQRIDSLRSQIASLLRSGNPAPGAEFAQVRHEVRKAPSLRRPRTLQTP